MMGYSFRCEHKIFSANLKRGPYDVVHLLKCLIIKKFVAFYDDQKNGLIKHYSKPVPSKLTDRVSYNQFGFLLVKGDIYRTSRQRILSI